MEQWIKIDDCYSVSSFGNVRNDEKRFILKQSNHNHGYLLVNLYGKKKYVHRLMIPFLDNPNNYDDVDHIDRNKKNNHISNLRMVSKSENGRNIIKKQNTTSQYKGVYFNKQKQKWFSRCKINGKTRWIGSFDNEVDAGIAYNNFCIKNKLTTAVLNII